MENQMETTIMENQMEKKMENEMETREYIALGPPCLWGDVEVWGVFCSGC